MAVDPPCGLADVRGEVATAFDLGDHLQQRDHLAEVAGDGCLQGEDLDAALLHLHGVGIDVGVAADDDLGTLEVAVEQHRRSAGDDLHHARREQGQIVARLVQILVERLAQLVHQPNRPVT